MVLNDGAPVVMGRSGYRLTLHQTYDIVEAGTGRDRYKVSTRGYIYEVHDKKGEVVSFHYHPESGIDFCHLHLRGVPQFRGVHFPTGRVAIEEVVLMLIRDFDVRPRRLDYGEVIERNLEIFRRWRTWHTR